MAIQLLMLALNAGICPMAADAISRAQTVLNVRVMASEAISRSVTVLNSRATAPSERISKAATIHNISPVKPSEAISRPGSILNTRAASAAEAISRAVSICDVGDFNISGQLDLGDIDGFVETLLDVEADMNRTWAADMNCDFTTDALDIQEFVDSLLE